MSNKQNIVAVNTIVRNKAGDKVLVLKRCKNEIAYPGFWAFPGGKMEPNETIFDALRRESLEEVGIDIDDGYKKFVNDFNFTRKDGYNVIGLVFEVKAKSEEVVLDKDFDDYKWVNLEEAMKLELIPGIEKELKIVFRENI